MEHSSTHGFAVLYADRTGRFSLISDLDFQPKSHCLARIIINMEPLPPSVRIGEKKEKKEKKRKRGKEKKRRGEEKKRKERKGKGEKKGKEEEGK